MSEDVYDRIDAMHERLDVLFPEKDRGYGDDMRRMLVLAEDRCARHDALSILSVLNELVGRMEADAREEAALDEYVTRMEAEALGA